MLGAVNRPWVCCHDGEYVQKRPIRERYPYLGWLASSRHPAICTPCLVEYRRHDACHKKSHRNKPLMMLSVFACVAPLVPFTAADLDGAESAKSIRGIKSVQRSVSRSYNFSVSRTVLLC